MVLFLHLGLINKNASYEEIKKFKDNLPRNVVYQKYHALIVEHAKRNYSKKPKNHALYRKFNKE